MPGASTLIRMLKNNGERNIEIIGTHMDAEAMGRFLVDKFYQVPLGRSKEYIPKSYRSWRKIGQTLFSRNQATRYSLWTSHKQQFENLGTKVLVSDPEPIHMSINKYKTYQVPKKKSNLNLPDTSRLNSFTNS